MQLTRDLTLEQLKPHSPQVDCGSNSSASDDASFGLHLFEPLVNQDNTADTLLEYLYRKMEFFLFKFVIVSA